MGNKILGKRSRSFYRGFNERQLEYLHQKFQTLAEKGMISKKLFMQAYKLNDVVCDKFLDEMDFTEDKKIEEYQFICMAHSLCSMSVEELGGLIYEICTKGKSKIDEKSLLNLTSVCLGYNCYLEKKKVSDVQIGKQNKNKFQKYDFDKNKIIDKDEFIKICMKDLDYKKWMFNMGFITQRQMDFQQQIYDLVDSDMQDQISRHEAKTNQNIDKIKRGIEHRIDDDEFEVVETVGEQSVMIQKPWRKSIRGIQIKKENQSAPSQNLTIDHIYGYRSYDCRNNLKFDSRGRIVYHQGAVGIVSEIGTKGKVQQSYLIQHQDDISCLDIADEMVATGQVGSKPMIIIWETTKKEGVLKEEMIISKELQNSVGNVCLAKSKDLLAASCNDEQHKIIIYDLKRLRQIQNDLTSQDSGVLAFGSSGKNCILDLKFTPDEKTLVAATLKQILWITFEKGVLNMNRGQYNNFSNSPTLCLVTLKATYKNQPHEFVLSGMGNGSVYFWQKGSCTKAVSGHSGSVSAICERKDSKSFISGDKTGKIIIWNEKFEKQKTVSIGKTNCVSKMIVSLSCSKSSNEFLIGTKSSDIFTLKIGDDFSKANRIMAGHSDGTLWGIAIHQTQPYFYTGGQDQRLLKWDYKNKKQVQKQVKCKYKIRSIDLNDNRKLLAVGYFNGTIQCFGADQLDKKPHSFDKIKNPDQETLNLVKFDGSGTMLAVCYQLPSFKILLLVVQQRGIKLISQIQFNHKIISLDFEKNAKLIQLNTADFQYSVYDISNPKQAKKIKASSQEVRKCTWLSHTVTFSPETRGIMTQGVSEQDIICCDRSKKFKNVIVIGDKFSKLKLFNYPTDKNQIFNKYFGHSNQVTGVKFNFSEDYLISIGGQQKSIIVWKYDPDLVNNQFFISNLLEGDSDYEEYKKEKQGNKELDEFAVEEETGQQAMATKPFLGQIFSPQDFQAMYNSKRDNKLPSENISIKHAFGIRSTYLKDQVRNQCKFTKNYEDIVFPTACLAIRMNIQNREQDIFLQHKEDIVSFAIDPKRQIMATGQMAEKNDKNKLKKILSIYVWDIQNKKVLMKLDGFHTIAVVLLSFSPNSKHLFTCGNDDKNTFAVYDWKSGSILYSGPVSRAKVNGIAWKNDHQFMTCGNDHVKFWTNNKGRQGKIKGQTAGMFSCVSAKSIYITGDGSGGLYNWVGDQSSNKINGHSGKVHTMIINGDYMYSGADDGKILAWRLQKNGQIKHAETFYDTRNAFQQMRKTIPINEQQYGVLSIDISKNGSFLIVTKGASVIHANPTRNQSKIVHQGHYKGELWALAVRNGQQFFVTGGDDCTVRLWDIKGRREINRVYFENKVRGIDCSNEKDCKIVVADSRARLHLYNKNLTDKLCQEYTGKPFLQNKQEKNDPFVQDIKFSPDSKYIAYGCHLKSRWMQFVKVDGRKLQKHKQFKAGTSALLNVDWSRDSSMISINTQAYELMFFNINGDKVSASSLREQNWATWTRKFGWPVQGIFQGVDYTDVNTVCRDPSGNYLAVGYDDQTIRLFRYPCYIPKQVSKQYYGHSSHVTRIKFSPKHLISIGGLDRTIIVWDIQNTQKQRKTGKAEYDQQSDGLEDLDQDVDVPGKAIARKEKPVKVQEFYETQDQGDEFMAIKPWLGAIKQPDEEYPKQDNKAPNSKLQLEYVQGYRCKDCRQNLYYSNKDVLIFHAAAVLIYHNITNNTQQIISQHADDILSIDYHRQSNQVITGELGPKPLVCLVKDGKIRQKFKAPVTKGVLALAISPNGERAVCVGMDDDHHVALLKLDQEKPLAKSKGGKKVILKVGWVSDSEFVTAGIAHFKYWTFDGKLSAKEGKNRQNLVSLAIKDGLILTGASKGKIISWKGNSKATEIVLRMPLKAKGESKEQPLASVVQSISIQSNFIAAGTKDGYLFILDKQNLKQINVINMEDVFAATNFKAESSALRAIDFLESQSSFCVGTLGSEIYTVKYRDLATQGKLAAKNILKCHYSPNNSWTNEVWGLYVQNDFIFTCSDDATLRCWSVNDKKLLSCVSLNYDQNKRPLEKDKQTRDFQDCAKGRAVCLSPDKQVVIVGCKDGTVRVYSFSDTSFDMQFKCLFRHAKEWISDIKTAYNTIIIGSHDNAIYVYDYEDGNIKRKYKPMKKHSSYITHLDVSRDSCFLQSTCGAYQILFWDLNTGKQITSGGTMLKNERWATWTCNLGWPVQGIYPKCTDGTFVNAVDRSHFSINQTLYQDDKKSPFLLATGNDQGKVCLYKYPCTVKSSEYVEGHGHSSHVTNVRWTTNDKYLISTGGQDQCVMYWKIIKNAK